MFSFISNLYLGWQFPVAILKVKSIKFVYKENSKKTVKVTMVTDNIQLI